MKSVRWTILPTLGLLLALPVAGQEGKPAKAQLKPAPAPAVAPSQDEVAKAWTAYMTPGEPHARLAKLAGKWTAKTKAWMDPAKPPEETTGSCEFRMVLGGRYLEQRFEGTMMGQPFSGIGYTGYDNVKKKYEAYWIDSAGTGMMVMSGTPDKSGTKTTYTGSMLDPISGKPVAVRSVDTEVDADHLLFEMWTSGPDGKMAKSLEMTYTRKK
jgi:hypothetical protein